MIIRLLLIATLAVILSYIGYQQVCLDFGDGTIVCGPLESPVSPASRVVHREWLPVIFK